MRLAALAILGWISTALAGPDGLYYALENRIEKGEILTLGTHQRIKIGGVGQLEELLTRAARPAQEARWVYEPALKDWVLVDQVGHRFNLAEAKRRYQEALKQKREEFELPVVYLLHPQGTTYYYRLGVRQLLAEATTSFTGSSYERSYNIRLGARRLNGVLVPPRVVFSFAQAVGEVSERTGFKKAFVISGEQTLEGVGGGICQVSTTLFRSAYFAGLPITQRRPHSYQVRYYQPTGLDAAVFLPHLDLKFKNDTPGHLLIQSSVSKDRLTFRIFGTKDRSVSWSGPVYLSRTPALPPRYIATPDLPPQRFVQVDWAAEGATVQVHRTIRFSDGRVVQDTLSSTYRPWGAVWLVGEGTRLKSGRLITAETDDAPDGHTYRLPTQTAAGNR
ncbi:Vancomycin B-type resistance protein VanW [Meiothermus luteus]|jgi:vancomycin resistance protein YoaR|uniref:Vancomycin B-type resistance protein VanW n=1 Tax=Meiothermus luteus TaxID=2026184 RepID=A0A399ESR1_9DEIN|nr:VanW family protein [Meiothermus luteus]RIH85632.1 Vancomycin B-type resistance protein VanW [Meiothermus luteus]RMH57192.1 MAG: vancomycin resistance protein [Deinococcota bacterium]